jgi:hypothetical protein
METTMKKLPLNRRGILALLLLVGCVAAALGGAIPFFYRDLPHPAKASREELLQWLVVKDVAAETPATQSALAGRLEAEFGSGVDWTAFQAEIDEPQRKQLLKNIPCVLRCWMLEKADAYGRLSADCRAAFLDRMIDSLEVWQGAEKLLPPSAPNGTETAKSPKLATILMREMERLQEESPASQQKRIGRFWTDVQMRWFLRSIKPKTSMTRLK